MFNSCYGLTSITIPKSISYIGEQAFLNCENITSIVIPDSVKEIGEQAFYGCEGLQEIIIPDSVTLIGNGAFYNCINLKKVRLSNSINALSKEMFRQCSDLSDIVIPNNIKVIDDKAFYHCNDLKEIQIPDSITNIGIDAFENCIHLESTNVDENNNHYKSIDGVLFNKTGTELIYYPANKKNSEYIIPDSVTHINDYALRDCYMDYIRIPKNLTSIGENVFPWPIKGILVDKENSNYMDIDGILYNKSGTELIRYVGKESTYTIPNGVTKIGDYAFADVGYIKSVEIPTSVTSIGYRAFYRASKFSSGVEGQYLCLTIPESVIKIEREAFREANISDVIILNSETSIGVDAFLWCDDINFKLYAKDPSTTKQYAQDNEIKFIKID